MNRVRGNELIAVAVLNFALGWVHLVHTRPVLHPVQINHTGAVVKSCVAEDVVIGISDEVRPGRPAKARVMQSFRLNRRMVEDRASAFEERANVVSKPKSGKDCAHWTC